MSLLGHVCSLRTRGTFCERLCARLQASGWLVTCLELEDGAACVTVRHPYGPVVGFLFRDVGADLARTAAGSPVCVSDAVHMVRSRMMRIR